MPPELTIEEEIIEIKNRIATIEETQARKSTPARVTMLEKLKQDLEWLENGGVVEEPEAPVVASPEAVMDAVDEAAAALSVASPRSRALSMDPGLSEKVTTDRSNREAIAESKWSITEAESAVKKKLVVVWNFNNTLLPTAQMKRGTDEERALFEEWGQFTEVVQNELQTNAGWRDAENIASLGDAGVVATRRVYEADCGIPEEELASLENDTERLSDNWITSGRKALAFVQARGGLNVIMTAAPLRATVAKLILFGMAKYVPLELVYSSNGSKEAGGKRDVGSRAIEAAKLIAGKKPKIIVIGAKGKEEEELASMHRASFFKFVSAKELLQIKEAVGA